MNRIALMFNSINSKVLIAFKTFMFLFTFSVFAHSNSAPKPSIYWSDGDSGRIDGVKFRLANIDAPETGRIGQRSGAKCSEEVELGKQAKAFVISLTNDANLSIIKNYGEDRYNRLVIDLSVNGEDIAAIGARKGFYKSWKHENGRSVEKKPSWCNIK
jgi:endonuclease YncB( thermonuclease family)